MVGRRLCLRRCFPIGIAVMFTCYLVWKFLYKYEYVKRPMNIHERLIDTEVIPGILPEEREYRQLSKLQYWEQYFKDRNYVDKNRNFVFIKCMKCATETVGDILRRFAFSRDLIVVLPRDNNIYLGWPYLMDQSDYRNASFKFNCLVEHSVFNKTFMKPLFPKDVKFITIIREPWDHFRSTFNYFNMKEIVNISSTKPISTYLSDLEKYENIYKSHGSAKSRHCIPDGFSVTKNLLSHCMGMPLGFPPSRKDISSDHIATQNYIESLKRDFDLVMIMEYFHESLVLLKRLMGWSFKDIVYRKVNVGRYYYESSEHDRLRHQKWSSIDYILYDAFNKTFWQKVKAEGENFTREVKVYLTVLDDIGKFCSSISKKKKFVFQPVKILSIGPSEFNEAFSFSEPDCNFMKEALLPLLQKRFAARYGDDVQYKRTC